MAKTPIGHGTVLAGRFVLEDLLDDSEGARFWRATDKILARDVGVHVISSDDQRATALLTAARTSATVTDGHLLRVLDAATEGDITYVVNEWGQGVSLDRLVAEGPLSPRRAAWVVQEVAEAISTAHRHGIAHGRLLPESVMITDSGSVKLIGFVVDAVLRGRESVRVTGGEPLGEHEADLVNLGALLYAGLTGRWAGTEGSTMPTAPQEHGRPLRPRQVRAGVPRPLDGICERVLGGGHAHSLPIETAHEVYAALCDYVGDPTATPALGEPTSLFDLNELAGGLPGPEIETPGEETQLSSRAVPVPRASEGLAAEAVGNIDSIDGDPDSTQVGAPVFDHPQDRPGSGSARVAPPPPPPLLDPEPRPLFASDHPRPDRPETGRPRSTGAGAGAVPDTWGPDADTPPPMSRARHAAYDDEPPGRSWLRLAAALAGVLVLVLAIIFAFNLGRGSIAPGEEESAAASPSESAEQEAPKRVQIAAVSDFDPPPGDGEENPDTAGLAADGDPATSWTTLTYRRVPELGNLKPGVGLMVDLGEQVEVDDVRLTLVGADTDVSLFAAPDAEEAPTETGQMQRVATQSGASIDVTLAPDEPVTTRFLLVWLTKLPPVSGGFRGEVSEIVVRS